MTAVPPCPGSSAWVQNVKKHSVGLRATLRYDTLKVALGGAAF